MWMIQSLEQLDLTQGRDGKPILSIINGNFFQCNTATRRQLLALLYLPKCALPQFD